MSDTIPIVVISLARAEQRRERIANQLAKLDLAFTVFEAVDGSSISPEEIAEIDPRYVPRHNRSNWFPGELGNHASFHRVLCQIADGDHDMVCVLEDDAILTPRFPAFVTAAILRSLPRFDVLRLESSWVDRYLPVAVVENTKIVAPYRLGPLACAQIFTRDAARVIAKGMVPARGLLDVTLYMDRRFPSLRIFDVMPAVVVHPADSSFIETSSPRTSPIASVGQQIRARFFKIGLDWRTASSFAKLWGLGAKQKLLFRKKGDPIR